MNNKTILKRIKKEGNMIVPNSFNALLDKVKSTDQYLAYQIKMEGEQLVPNNYSSIKRKLKKKIKQKVYSPLKKDLFLWLPLLL